MKLRRHPRRLLRRLWPRRQPANTPPLSTVAPDFARELHTLLTKAGRLELARSIPTLQIYGRCPCTELACASIYTAPWRDDAITLWARPWTTLPLQPGRGEINLNIANNQIVAIEILGRRDVRAALEQPTAAPDSTAKKNDNER